MITGCLVKNHPTLGPMVLVSKNRQFLFVVNYSRIREPPVPVTSKTLKNLRFL
jgi:hypothetical protein